MRKILTIILLALATTLSAQYYDTDQHVLVAFFSATGTTRQVAQILAQEHNGRLWEIEPMEAYLPEDLDWKNPDSRSSLEMADPNERTIIKMCTWIDPYDTIYLGFPIWWGICPRIINSWIENNILDGKVIIPFATSGSSTIEKAVAYLRETYPDVNFTDGILMNNRLR